jgi:Protein of unknown function (DUF3313)
MKWQIRHTLFQAVVILIFGSFRPIAAWSQMPDGAQLASANAPTSANWSTTKHGKHLTIRVNTEAEHSTYDRITVGTVTYTGKEKKLKPEESDKLASILRDSLTKDLSVATLSDQKSAAGSLILNADITYVKRVHPWVNVLTMAAVFVPLDFGGANVTAQLVDRQTGQIVAQIETVGCGQIYEVLASLQPLGQSKLALKKDSRAIAQGVTRINRDQRPSTVNEVEIP